MMKIATPKEPFSHEPMTSPVFAALGAAPSAGWGSEAPRRKRSKFTHHIWTRGDGFTLSGGRKP